MAEHYDIFYYNTRGFCEPSRYILALAEKTHGITWTDHRTELTQFPSVLPPDWKARCPYGQVPLLEFNGQKLNQSQAIARFLAKKFGLVSKDDLEAARCDEIVDSAKDLLLLFFPLYVETDETKIAEVRKNGTETAKSRYLSTFNELAGQNDGKYLVGDALTWADIVVTSNLDHLKRTFGLELLDDYPHLQSLIQNVQGTPGIKEWIERRPNTKL